MIGPMLALSLVKEYGMNNWKSQQRPHSSGTNEEGRNNKNEEEEEGKQ